MRRFRTTATWMGLLVVVTALVGCAGKQFDPAKAPSPDRVGYHVNQEAGEVLFFFQPAFAEQVTENGTDKRMEWNGPVDSVYIAGEFNGWDRYGWPMQKDAGTGVFTLSKSLVDVGGAGDHLFKFVINGEYWVEPPAFAKNKVEAGIGNDSMNWTLVVPAAVK